VTCAIVLFTRDLRVRGHAALSVAALEFDQVLPLFVLDRDLLAGSCGSPRRLAFLLDSLGDLDRSLGERGGRLIVRHGDVVGETIALARECDAKAIHLSADTTPYARARQRALGDACAGARIALRTFPGVTVVAPSELAPAGGDHYRIFTPYWRVWRAAPSEPLPRAPRRLSVPTASGLDRRRLDGLRPPGASPALPRGGESEARRLLERWLRGGLSRYDSVRDDLGSAATSHLSAHLHFGCVAAASVLERTRPADRTGAFARQLCWRDFHHQVLAARPDMLHADYHPRGDRWRRDAGAAEAWRHGATGYPIVDAGMRQLASEGYIHNRARLIVASFLTKSLYLDWRLGAAHFARMLVDADVANNVGNWQWIAGTGNDTRPNRVLNPLRQARRFDPDGDYVRRHVEELADVDGAAVHEPWRLPARRRTSLRYPPPLIDPAAIGARLRRARSRSHPET